MTRKNVAQNNVGPFSRFDVSSLCFLYYV